MLTKSNDKLDSILSRPSNIRSNISLPKVKCYVTNNAVGDGNLWKSHFLELCKDVIECISLNSNLVSTSISDDDYLYISSATAINNWAMSVILSLEIGSEICIGINCKWNSTIIISKLESSCYSS